MDDKMTDAKHQPSKPAAVAGSSGPRRLTTSRIVAVAAAASLLVGLIAGPIIANHFTSAAGTPGTSNAPSASAAATDTTGTPEHTITVSGSGDVSVAPDVADVVLGVSATKSTVKDARAAAAAAMTAVLAAVKKDGVADKDISTVNLSLSPNYDYSSGKSVPALTGYTYSNTIKVTVRDLTTVAAVVDDSTAAGATTVQGISFRLDDTKAAEAQARQLAMTDAKARADALAQAAGVSIKGVAMISEVTSSPVTYYPQYSAGLAAAAPSVSTPIQTGTTDVTVQVTVSYLIG
jgi:Uncharacterized conserved protein